MHDDKVRLGKSTIQGSGVFARVAIRAGEAVLAIDDTRIVTAENPLRPEEGELEEHQDYLADGTVTLMQYPECCINHSCSPNTYVKTLLGVRYVFALRGILAGEEITYDYCINGFGDTVWECNCGSPRCRKTIHSDFFHLPFDLQVEYLPLLDDLYVRVYAGKVLRLMDQILNIPPVSAGNSPS